MKKLTQKDLVVLYLSQFEGWLPAYAFRGKETTKGWIGSEADRRLLEVMDLIKKQGYYEVEGMRYLLEERKNGRYKEYKIVNRAAKPRQNITFRQENGKIIAQEYFL